MLRTTLPCLLIALACVPASASAHQTTASSAERPQIASVRCSGTGDTRCAEGEYLRVSGEYLAQARRVVFLGERGRADNRRVNPRSRSPHRVLIQVPAEAPSGRVRVVAETGRSPAGPAVRVIDTSGTEEADAGSGDSAFPVRGKSDFGTETNRFGGGRNHRGQDIFAACGTPVAAALPGKVRLAKWQDAAGNYVVVDHADGSSQAYMHLLEPAGVAKGDRVSAGQVIGSVGETGRATGCHLHFELWTAPGWYEGGEAIDPLPFLRRLDGAR